MLVVSVRWGKSASDIGAAGSRLRNAAALVSLDNLRPFGKNEI